MVDLSLSHNEIDETIGFLTRVPPKGAYEEQTLLRIIRRLQDARDGRPRSRYAATYNERQATNR